MKWLNIISLLLQFIAFWFAAPELLGEKTLARFEKGLKKLITLIPSLFLFSVISIYSVSVVIEISDIWIKFSDGTLTKSELFEYYWFIGIATALYMILIFSNKTIKSIMEIKFATPLTEKLIHDNEIRKNSLLIGAGLFSVGFFIELVYVILNT